MNGYYDDVFEELSNARALGWRDSWGQAVRFAAVCDYIGPQQSVIDLGCGRGDLLRYMRHRGHQGSYLGVDVYDANAPFVPEDGEFAWSDLRSIDRSADVAVSIGTLVGNLENDELAAIELLTITWDRSIETAVIYALDPDWLESHVLPDPALRGISIELVEEFAHSRQAHLRIDTELGTPEHLFVLSRGPIAAGRNRADRYQSVVDYAKPNAMAALRLAVESSLEDEAQAILREHPNEDLRAFYEILVQKKRGTHHGPRSTTE